MTTPEKETGPLFEAAEDALFKDTAYRARLYMEMMRQEQGSRQQEICADLYDAESERLDPFDENGKPKWAAENEACKSKKKRRK